MRHTISFWKQGQNDHLGKSGSAGDHHSGSTCPGDPFEPVYALGGDNNDYSGKQTWCRYRGHQRAPDVDNELGQAWIPPRPDHYRWRDRAASTNWTRNSTPKAMRMIICQSSSETKARPTQKSIPPRLSCIWRPGWSSSTLSLRLFSRADQIAMERTARSQASARIQMVFEMREFQFIKDI